MLEDFGDWGDERFLNLCAEDWLWDVNERRLHDEQERRLRQLQEDEIDDMGDLFDIPETGEYEEWDCEMYDGEE